MIQYEGQVIPIEVKEEENLRAKALQTYVQVYGYLKGLRFSISDYRNQEWMENVLLYAEKSYL